MVEKTFSSMPYDNNELSCMLSFGKRVDDLPGLPVSPMSVVEVVFGNPIDVVFTLTLKPSSSADAEDEDEDNEFQAADGYCLYILAPEPSLAVDCVEVGYSDGTMQANVPIISGKFISSKRLPSYARVKSTARKTAFARLCAKPCIQEFYARVVQAEVAMDGLLLTWNANAYNAFESVLGIVKDASRHCNDVRSARDAMCALHIGEPMTSNVLVDAVLATAACPETACSKCMSAAEDIKLCQQSLASMSSAIFHVASEIYTGFFASYGGTASLSGGGGGSAPVAFSPPGCEEKTRAALRACLEDCNKKAVRPLPLPLPPFLSLTTPSSPSPQQGLSAALKICGYTSRATRLREISGRSYRDTIAGHWNDACATASLCESLQESILARLLVIVPDLDTASILCAGACIDDFARHSFLFMQDFRRCLKRSCVNVEADLTALDVDDFLKLQCSCNALKGKLEKVSRATLVLCEAIQAAAHFESVLSRVLYTEREMAIKRHHLAEKRMHTYCPYNNTEYILYGSDGSSRVRKSSLQHARFECDGDRIHCVDANCLRSRGVFGGLDGGGGRDSDPMQAYLQRVGCTACLSTGPFAVTPSGDNVFCVACEARVHCPPTVVERHDDVNCPRPDAGILTCLVRGSMTCQGCGLVISDYVCVEGVDERTFADDDADSNPCRHSTPASTYLSNGSNVTFISAPRGGVTAAGLTDLKKYTRAHKRLNTYVPTDDMMRMTTWVKRDEHIKHFQNVLLEAMAVNEIQISHVDKNLALQRFKNIRWYSEKMYGVRLVIFTLTANAVLQARHRRIAFKVYETSICARCGISISVKEVGAHIRSCRPKPKPKPAGKRRRDVSVLSMLSFC